MASPDEVWASLTPVEATAVKTSYMRARAAQMYRRPDGSPLYSTPWDEAISNACLPKAEQQKLEEWQVTTGGAFGMMGGRTAALDDLLMASLEETTSGQVVLLGCGLDTRAWRLHSLPQDLLWIDVDTGSTEALKVRVLAGQEPSCKRLFLQLDLSDTAQLPTKLEEAGLQLDRPTVWLLEGLVGYLTVPSMTSLFRDMHRASGPGSKALITAPPTPEQRDKHSSIGMTLLHATFEQSEDTMKRLKETGWEGKVVSHKETAAKYGVKSYVKDILVVTAK